MRVLRSLSSTPSRAERSLPGSRGLRGRQLARRAAHLLSEARQLIGGVLAIAHHLVNFLGRRTGRLPAGVVIGILARNQVAHTVGLRLLLGGELLGGLGQGVEAAGGVLLLGCPSRSVASRRRSAARRESAGLAFAEAARRMSSLAWRRRSSACCAACWRLWAACSADCRELAPSWPAAALPDCAPPWPGFPPPEEALWPPWPDWLCPC